MSDDVARAVGANGRTIKVAGKECTVRPLKLRELTELQRMCLECYKDKHIESYARGVKKSAVIFTDVEEQKRLVQEEIEKVSSWDLDDLPVKYVYDASSVVITDKLKEWLYKNTDFDDKGIGGKKLSDSKLDVKIRRRVVTSLENNALSEDVYKELTGSEPVKVKVKYEAWWVTATVEGMLATIWMAFRDNGLERDDVINELGDNPDLMTQLSREIEHLTAPASGNG